MKMKFKKNKHEHEVAETPDQIMEDTAAEELETLDEREPEILDDVSASDDTEIHGRLGDFQTKTPSSKAYPRCLKSTTLKKVRQQRGIFRKGFVAGTETRRSFRISGQERRGQIHDHKMSDRHPSV